MPKAQKKRRCMDLMAAVSTGNLQEAKRHLNQSNTAEKHPINGQTPLLLAAKLGHVQIVKLLLAESVPYDIRDSNGNTALHLAGNKEVVDTLIETGLDINARNHLGRSPLLYAIKRSHFDVVSGLIDRGADVNAQDSDGNTAMHYLSKCYHYLHMSIILEGKLDLLDEHERNIKVPTLKRTHNDGFHHLMLEPDHDLFELICQVNEYTKAHKDQTTDETLVALARANDKLELAKKLIQKGADLTICNFYGQTSLHLAVSGSNKELILLLCSKCPSTVNIRDNVGLSPLLKCLSFIDHYDDEEQSEIKRKMMIFNILYKHGADLSVRDINGFGLLSYAFKPPQLFKHVLKLDPDVNERTCIGASLLHIVAANDGDDIDEAILEDLVRRGLNINCRDKFGMTPLFYAVWAGNTENIDVLVNHGARVDALDHAGRTAADLADFSKREDIGDALRAVTKEIHDHQGGNDSQENGIESSRDDQPMGDACALHHSLPETPYNFALCIERCEDVPKMFKAPTLPVDGSDYIRDLLESPITGRTFLDEENREIRRAVLFLVTKIGEQFEKLDPRFKLRMELSGSVNEGTKNGRADEFDFLCCLENFEKHFHAEEGDSDPPGFVSVVASDDSEDFKEWRARSGNLINSKVIETCYRLLYRALHTKSVWEDTKVLFPSLNYVPTLCREGPSMEMSLFWSGERLKHLTISVDMVVAIYFANWWPKSATDHLEGFGRLYTEGCHVVLSMYMDKMYHNPDPRYDTSVPRYFRLSFSRAEGRIFQSLPQAVKDGFILAKALREQVQPCMGVYNMLEESAKHEGQDVPQPEQVVNDSGRTGHCSSYIPEVVTEEADEDDDSWTTVSSSSQDSIDDSKILRADIINTYMLKMVLFHCLNTTHPLVFNNIETPNDEDTREINTQVAFQWARRLYRTVDSFVKVGPMPSFFVPGYTLLDRKDTKDIYVFDDKFTEEELDDAYEAEQKIMKTVYSPLPENMHDSLEDDLPDTIAELQALVWPPKETKLPTQPKQPKIPDPGTYAKLRALCFRENVRIFIAIIETVFRECKEYKKCMKSAT